MSVRRGIALIFVAVGGLVFLTIAATIVAYLVVARGPRIPDRATLVLRPGGQIRDAVPEDVVGQLLGRNATTLRGMIESLDKAGRDSRISAVLLLPSTLESPFWGKVQELRDAIIRFRRTGKTVIAFLEYGGDREYFLASAADRVFLLPTSPLDLTGVASHEVFLRGTLDKLGAYPDFLQIGAYKTAVNQLTQKGFTPAHREMTEALTQGLYEQLVRGIAESRHKTPDEVRALIDQGPFTPEDARSAGLVDDLAYLDQLDDRVAVLQAPAGESRRVEESDYRRVRAETVGIRRRSRIAVLYASGVIASGRSAFDPVNGDVIGSDTLVEQIQRIRDDDAVKAIVLRVDSPGGSSIASDVIWRELTITRDAKPSRPLVASMSDLAASGGYYISMPAQVIVAEPSTLTGSIGVFGGKIVIRGTLDKAGVTTETVKSGKNADIDSPFAPFSVEERAKLQAYMDSFYETFVLKAAASRHMTRDQVDALAQGRVWTGAQARERGLVDRLGGLDDAVAVAKERAGIPSSEDVELMVYPPRRTFFETLSEELRSSAALPWSDLIGTGEGRAIAALAAPARLFRRGEPLALMPFGFVR